MATASYFESAFPEPWQILGLRLYPFSLGHYIKLYRFSSPFVSDKTAEADLGDLVLGCLVCSMQSDPDPSKDEFWQWWTRPAKPNFLAALFRKQPMTPAERDIVRWGRKVGVFDVGKKVALFAEYVSRHSNPPGYWVLKEPSSGQATSGAHWSHAVIHGLVSQCGYSQLEAYNVPMAKALQDYMKAAEEQGQVRLMTEEEIAFTEAQKKHGS